MLRGWSYFSSSSPTMAPLNKFDVIVHPGDGDGNCDGDGLNFRLRIMTYLYER